MAVVVPLTISTAVGAATIVGERERGTGEFLAHSPAGVREIYLGKLIASLIPGYFTTLVGFGAYSLLVNLVVGPEVGGWFFPTPQWWLLMLWVVPPFLALALSLVLRLSARVRSTAAAHQASGLITLPLIMIAYSQSTGALFGATRASLYIGAVAWLIAIFSLSRGMSKVSRARLLGVIVQAEFDGDAGYQRWADNEELPEVERLLRLNGREESIHGRRVEQAIALLSQ